MNDLILALREIGDAVIQLANKAEVAASEIDDPNSPDDYKAMIRARILRKLNELLAALEAIRDRAGR